MRINNEILGVTLNQEFSSLRIPLMLIACFKYKKDHIQKKLQNAL